MNKVDDLKFIDLLPMNLRGDSKFKAAAAVLDAEFEKDEAQIKNMLVYSMIDELDEASIDDLAWGFGMDWFEGYMFADTLDDKRELVKTAIQLKMYKGTRWGLERVSGILRFPMEIIEWWESDIESGMVPGEFEVFVDTTYRGFSKQFYQDLVKLIHAHKNVRSHLKIIKAMIVSAQTVYVASAAQIVAISAAAVSADSRILSDFEGVEYHIYRIDYSGAVPVVRDDLDDWYLSANIEYKGDSLL